MNKITEGREKQNNFLNNESIQDTKYSPYLPYVRTSTSKVTLTYLGNENIALPA